MFDFADSAKHLWNLADAVDGCIIKIFDGLKGIVFFAFKISFAPKKENERGKNQNTNRRNKTVTQREQTDGLGQVYIS